jgi:PDZ domain
MSGSVPTNKSRGFVAHRIWIGVIAGILWSLGAIAQTDIRTRVMHDASVRFTPSVDHVVVPFELVRNKIILRCRVNNSALGWFLLDTGAVASVIDRNIATAGSPRQVGNVTVEGVGGSEAALVVGPVTLSMGALDLANDGVLELSLAEISSVLGRQIDGVLGSNSLHHLVLQIDFKRRTLTFSDPRTRKLISRSGMVALEIREGRPFVAADLRLRAEGPEVRNAWFLLDTGVDDAVYLNGTFLKLRGLVSDTGQQPRVEWPALGVGGWQTTTAERVDMIRLGPETITKFAASISSNSQGLDGPADAGAIGLEFLRRFNVVLDFESRQMGLYANSSVNEPYDLDMSGLLLAFGTPAFKTIIVKGVRSSSPAAQAGVKAGDELSSIDGRSASELGLDRIDKMFRQAKREYRLQLKRENQSLSVTLLTKRAV